MLNWEKHFFSYCSSVVCYIYCVSWLKCDIKQRKLHVAFVIAKKQWSIYEISIWKLQENCMTSLKSSQVMVRLHIFPVFSFLSKMLSSLSRNDNIFARNENIGKICMRTITWTDFSWKFLNIARDRKDFWTRKMLKNPWKLCV